MSKQTINIGSAADDGTGDPGRTAFDKTNGNFTELYDLILGGQFTSDVVDGAGKVAFNFDSDNTITTGKLFNFSSNGTDILSLLDDGSETTLKFHQSNAFGNTNVETSSPLGEFTFKEALGGTMTIDPLNGKFTTSSTTLTFGTSGGDAFDVSSSQFRPSTANRVNLGAGGFEWKNLSMAGVLNFGVASDFDLVKFTHVANTGLKIASASTESIAFYGSTPIDQPSSSGENTGYSAVGGTNVNHQDTFTGNVGSTAYTINDIVKHLKNLGLIAL